MAYICNHSTDTMANGRVSSELYQDDPSNISRGCISFHEDRILSLQTVHILMKCCKIWPFIWVFSVCKNDHLAELGEKHVT